MVNTKNAKHTTSGTYTGASTTGGGPAGNSTGNGTGTGGSATAVNTTNGSQDRANSNTSVVSNGGNVAASASSSRQVVSGSASASGGHRDHGVTAATDDVASYNRDNNNGANNTGKRMYKGKEPVREIPPLDFNTLDISVLRRYRRIYKLKIPEPANKETLVREISKHYASLKLSENEVIAQFIYAVHNKDNVLKLPIP